MEVPFPAVSICYQIDSWKWPGIIKAMIEADEANIIEQLYLNDTFLFRAMKDQLQMGILGFKKSQKYESLREMSKIGFTSCLAIVAATARYGISNDSPYIAQK